MKLSIKGLDNQKTGELELPLQFAEPMHPDLIKRAVETLQANARQRYGADPEAGKRASAKLSRRRHNYKGSYGRGISRVPRKVLTHSGTQFNFVGAFAPGTVSGRRAHPPTAEKDWSKKINKKENQKAIRSALSATVSREIVSVRHKVPESYPFAVDDSFEQLSKTKDVTQALKTLGLDAELARTRSRTIRAGKGTMRNRKYKSKTGLLLVVSGECAALKASRNIPGVDVVPVNSLNAQLLAPGSEAGRAAIFSKSAIEKIGKERLFAK